MAHKKLYAKRKALGLCPTCGKGPPLPDYAFCEACREAQKEAHYKFGRRRYPHDPDKERRRQIRRNYRLTHEEAAYWDQKARTGVCAICGAGGTLMIDHDHSTGEVRDVLCRACNFALGFLKDSVELLDKARAYLLLHGGS